ncbi:MAG: copper resistance system multicopper oxidase [Gammaproteobacteria bacterium]|nr:copper resistance system multicopper oxidase [Gammaproteobacteria bacterium]
MNRNNNPLTRRHFLKGMAAMGLLTGLDSLAPAYAAQYDGLPKTTGAGEDGQALDLRIQRTRLRIGEREAQAVTINGSIPGTLVRLREGQNAVLRVTNELDEDTSIHWHGIILPAAMDGVPGVSFAGIKPGETFTYQFPVRQSGTYWYHSHSGMQEQLGHFGPMIIDPLEPEPFSYDREYVVMLSDWTFENPHHVVAKLKKQSDYYNFQQRTVGDFFRDVSKNGWDATMAERLMWAQMRMSPTDFADVSGYTYTYLMNGLAPGSNWSGLFRPGERVRLRFINAASMTYFDVRIPGLKMTVVQVDGQNVQPVTVDEFRTGVAETYDVIVEPQEDRAYTIFAETMDRSGYARGTLTAREGLTAPIPERRPRPLRTMADMGMGGMGDMQHDMPGMQMDGMDMEGMEHDMSGMDMEGMQHDMPGMDMSGLGGVTKHGPDTHGPGNSMIAETSRSRLHEPGSGLENTGTRVLVYTDLRSVQPMYDKRAPGREIELHLTGNMERYMWSFDGKKYSEAREPIAFQYGERLRLVLVNDTMMDHPIHLHGMWMELENGAGDYLPRKHTISVKPGERLSLLITADALGNWAFHCHLLIHMDMGMFRVVSVSRSGMGEHS